MSLQVWLPLCGNTNNQGLGGHILNGSPASWSQNGKIGSCATFNGNVKNILYNNTTDLNYTDNFSFCLWINPNYTGSAIQYAFTVGRADYGGYGYGLDVSNASTIAVRFGNVVVYVSCPSNEWHHIAFTVSGTVIKVYKDGILYKTTATGTLPTYSDGNGLGIGCFHFSSNIYPFYGSLNDFRIYDHCLSAKEVKEISKGLMCHYKLSGCGGENLIKGNFSCTSTKDTYSATGSVTCTLTADDIMANLGKTLTLSYKVKSTGAFTSSVSESSFQYNRFGIHGRMVYVNTSGSTVTTYPLADLLIRGKKEGLYYSKWTIPTDIASVNERLSFSVQTNPSGGFAKPASDNDETWYIKDVKLEWGSKPTPWCPNPADELYSTLGYNDATEYDCSGYGNNGTKVGDIVWKGDSARYSGSYGISGTNSIHTSSIAFENIAQGTLSFWIKFNNAFNNWSHYVYFANSFNRTGNGADFIIIANYTPLSSTANASSTNINIDCCSYGKSVAVTTDEWYHIAITWDAKNYVIKKYFNGELIQTVDDGTNKRLDTYRLSHKSHFIGNGSASTEYSGNFNISDLRIFSTVLDDSDIKSLYNVAASADKSGVLSAYEFVEG